MLTATKIESTVNPNISLSTLSREGKEKKKERKKERNETKRKHTRDQRRQEKTKKGKKKKKRKEKPRARTQINLGSWAGRGIRAVRVEQGPRELKRLDSSGSQIDKLTSMILQTRDPWLAPLLPAGLRV
jgi:hypothetical protein